MANRFSICPSQFNLPTSYLPSCSITMYTSTGWSLKKSQWKTGNTFTYLDLAKYSASKGRQLDTRGEGKRSWKKKEKEKVREILHFRCQWNYKNCIMKRNPTASPQAVLLGVCKIPKILYVNKNKAVADLGSAILKSKFRREGTVSAFIGAYLRVMQFFALVL